MMRKNLSMKLVLLLVLVVFGIISVPRQESLAATTAVQVCAVSYSDESVLVFTNGNSKIYYGSEMDAARNNWDVIEVDPLTERIAVIDISWLSSNVESILMVKGDENATQSRIIIKEKPSKLEVSINYSQLDTLDDDDNIGPILNVMSTEGTADDPLSFDDLQWKKGDDGRWISSDFLTKRVLENYLIRGTHLYFRVAPMDDIVDAKNGAIQADISERIMNFPYLFDDFTDITFGTDYPDGTEGRRASGEVRLKIAKKAILPVTGIDGEDFKVDIKYGQEYRVTTTSGSAISVYGWTKVTDRSVKKLPISTMIGGTRDGLFAGSSFPEMVIEIRNYSTSKASSSKVTETHLDAQRILPGSIIAEAAPLGVSTADKNIYISYNGTKNLNIQIPSASEDNPYEYCVVRQGYSFNLEKASWSSITKGTMIKILSSKAVDYSTLYIRQKEVKYQAETDTESAVSYKLASTMQTFNVNYPSIPTAVKTTYIYTKGYPTTIFIDVTLNVIGKMPYETKLKYIKLGTKDVPVDKVIITPSITSGIDPNQVYTMRIILQGEPLKLMTNCTARVLGIYYENGTVDKTSSKLTIKSPTAALKLTTTVLPGIAVNTTAVTVVNPVGVNNHFVYAIGNKAVAGLNMEDQFTTGLSFTNGMDILINAGDYLTIYELDKDNFVVKYESILIGAADIKK
ncbi:MAG: hypothetical protein K0R34_1526 [Herbinix sp.]|jgi:hypothetical protein|nr:hypothetical protein [Herbinix sp.]